MMSVLSFVYACNARCPNCPYNNSDIRAKYKGAIFMPENIFKKIADESGEHGSYLRLSGGGEPMLHPQAVDLMLYAKSRGAKIGLITNASKFTRQDLEKLIAAGVDAIECSVDAPDEVTYNKVRPGLDWATFSLPDFPPGARQQIGLVLEFVPDGSDPFRVITYTDGRYVHEFPFAALTPRQVVVEGRLAGPLELGVARRTLPTFLPVVMHDYRPPWWPQAVGE